MTSSEIHHNCPARFADLWAYAHLFDIWSRARSRAVLTGWQFGYLKGQSRGRHRPAIPLLHLLVEPGRSIDFDDPRIGFGGLTCAPGPSRALTIWADNLLSVRHGEDWIYVIDAGHPFTSEWLDLLRPTDGAAPPPFAVVTATFDGPAPIGEFSLAEVEAAAYTTLARIEDLR